MKTKTMELKKIIDISKEILNFQRNVSGPAARIVKCQLLYKFHRHGLFLINPHYLLKFDTMKPILELTSIVKLRIETT